MWKFCGKAQFPHSFGWITRSYTETVFPQNFHTRKLSEITVFYAVVKDTEKKHLQMKLQRLRKVWICTFGLLIHLINSFEESVTLKQNFQKNKVATGKTPAFVIGPFCTSHFICLSIGFWQSSFVLKYCAFNLNTLNWKTVFEFF